MHSNRQQDSCYMAAYIIEEVSSYVEHMFERWLPRETNPTKADANPGFKPKTLRCSALATAPSERPGHLHGLTAGCIVGHIPLLWHLGSNPRSGCT